MDDSHVQSATLRQLGQNLSGWAWASVILIDSPVTLSIGDCKIGCLKRGWETSCSRISNVWACATIASSLREGICRDTQMASWSA